MHFAFLIAASMTWDCCQKSICVLIESPVDVKTSYACVNACLSYAVMLLQLTCFTVLIASHMPVACF